MFPKKSVGQQSSFAYIVQIVLLTVLLVVMAGCARKSPFTGQVGGNNQKNVDEPLSEEYLLRLAQEKEKQYQTALKLMEDGEYKDAMEAFNALGEYENAKRFFTECREHYKAQEYDDAVQMILEQNFTEARSKLNSIRLLDDSSYKGTSILVNYCDQQNRLEEIRNALDQGNFNQAADLLEYTSNCAERVELYYRMKEMIAFSAEEADAAKKNKLVFDERYSVGSTWIIEDDFSRVTSDLDGTYYLGLKGAGWMGIDCYGINMEHLKNLKGDEHFVIIGTYSREGLFSYIFTNCRILSETSDHQLSGVFSPEISLAEATGADEYLRQFEEAMQKTEPAKKVHDADAKARNATHLIEMQYYSVEIPSDWWEQVYLEIDEASQSITFTEKQNYDADNGGFLATIGVYAPEEASELEEINRFPIEYRSLGYILTDNGENYFLMEMTIFSNRSRVWGDEVLDEAYLTATEGLQTVYENIRGNNGCDYIADS